MAIESAVDGRRARRDRSRRAVIDAVFALVQEGKVPPSVEDIADRAGVSVSSVFRNFDGLPDIQRQAFDSFQTKFAHLFVVDDADRALDDRVRAHVRSRIELFGVAGSLMRVGRARAIDHEPMVEGLSRLRGRLADQTRQRFAHEIRQLTPADAANLTALIDSITSPDAYEVMSAAHARSPRQVTRTWTTALDVVLQQWIPSKETRT